MVVGRAGLDHALSRDLSCLHERAFKGQGRGWKAAEIADLAIAPGGLLIVDHNVTPIGFSLFRQVEDEAELLTLAVDPKHWNKGFGRALLTEGCSELALRGCSELFLEVAVGNDRASALYRGLGFSVVGERRGYFSSDETGTAYLMRLPLNLSIS